MTFWDRETGEIARRIDVDAKVVYQPGTDTLLESGATITNKGVEEALNIVAETPDGVKTSKWVGDCFIGTSSSNRLCYSWLSMPVPSNSPLYVLGYTSTSPTTACKSATIPSSSPSSSINDGVEGRHGGCTGEPEGCDEKPGE
ncbi:hypothetical protein BKA70DRAFT_1441445 [Coprinopsis sp. MPI-PUGE-AT-0042]|nr:hypothetical protein BKA70DRAFT_1441445 [Coprinopsis sp. MPI-PUGE-AT-0042]